MKENEQFIRGQGRIENAPLVDVEKVITRLSTIPEIELPRNKKQIKVLEEVLLRTTADSPMKIYVGSCPDYSHEDGRYTHKDIGGGIPLLSQVHVGIDLNLLKALDSSSIPYEYIIMVADVEAVDEVFCDKFTKGNQEEFLKRCNASLNATQGLLDSVKENHNLKGTLRSSSFFAEFGYDNFIQLQDAYMEILLKRLNTDDSFRQRVGSDINSRMGMYTRMYDQILPKLGFIEQTDFLEFRDIRTKAQYLTLGRTISAASENAAIISHPTTNLGLFNDRNKFILETDKNMVHKTIPIFGITKNVY